MKYLSFDTIRTTYSDGGGSSKIYENDGNHSGWGFGYGLNATFPIAENLFLLATLSGFYGFGEDKVNETSGLGGDSFHTGGRDIGFNSSLSIAYYIDSTSTVISIGGRYQYFNSKTNEKLFNIKMNNKIYGITLAATYSFGI